MDSLIFDVDGTLWNSTDVVADSWNQVIQEKANMKPFITASVLKSQFGKTLPDIAASLFPSLPADEQLRLVESCCQREEELLRERSAPLYPDIEKVFQTLSKRYPIFIVSNCQAGYIEVFLHCTGFTPYVTDHLCPGDTGKGKAENIKEIVRRHKLKNPAYIGDTLGDYHATKEASADMPFIFASYGFGEVAHPDYTIQKPMDLLDLLKV